MLSSDRYIERKNRMREQVLDYCRNKSLMFHTMSDLEIYNYICDAFWIENFTVARECSLIIFRESR